MASKKGTKRACPAHEAPPAKKQMPPSKTCEEDMRAILRTHGAAFEREVSRLGPNELELMGVANVLAKPFAAVAPVQEYEPAFTPRKTTLTAEEVSELEAMRLRRNTLVQNVFKLIETRFDRGFICKHPEWITMVKNMVVVAAVGSENMHGPFDYCEWVLKYARASDMIDPSSFARLGVTSTDVQLMFAISLYTFVQACWRVHAKVRQSQAIPAVQRGNFLYALRVIFGTFSVPGKPRDTAVLVLAGMMISSTLSYEALQHVHVYLAEIAIPVTEWPVLTDVPVDLFLRIPDEPVVANKE